MDSLFMQQEQIFDIMISSLLELDSVYDTDKLSRLFKAFLDNNPLISVIGFLDTKGNYIYISNEEDPANLPNLIEQQESSNTFLQTLDSDRMVIGRTYYFQPLDSTIIPMRKRVQNAKGETIAVLAATIDISNPDSYFSKPVHLNSNEIFTVVREFDNYVQYRSIENDSSLDYLQTPIPDELIDRTFSSIKWNKKFTREEMKHNKGFATAETTNRWGKKSIATFTYNANFDLWIISDIQKKGLWKRFIPIAVYIIATHLALMLMLFLLTNTISNAKKRQREVLIKQAEYDYLTNLPNVYYLRQVQNEWTAAEAPPFYLIAFNIDNYKYINDYFGQDFGNKLIKVFSEKIREMIGAKAILARIEGDEFYIFSKADSGILNKYSVGNISTILRDILTNSIQELLC